MKKAGTCTLTSSGGILFTAMGPLQGTTAPAGPLSRGCHWEPAFWPVISPGPSKELAWESGLVRDFALALSPHYKILTDKTGSVLVQSYFLADQKEGGVWS
jgi:phosphotransacetylase